MRYCPNPNCRHRRIAKSQAEYFDHVEVCADCGATLVAEPNAYAAYVIAEQDRAAAGPRAPDKQEDFDEQAKRARMDVITGVVVLLAGVVISGVTYGMALGGGVYLVAWGPMIWGAWRIHRGLSAPVRH